MASPKTMTRCGREAEKAATTPTAAEAAEGVKFKRASDWMPFFFGEFRLAGLGQIRGAGADLVVITTTP